jgi:methionine-gamma-lyase
MVSFEVFGDPHGIIAGVRLITPAVSLGSVDTLIQHPASLSHRIVGEGGRRAAGVGDRLLRMSVGLEDVEDLWADLCQALSAAPPARTGGGAAASTAPPSGVPVPSSAGREPRPAER